ncbi:MAG: BrnT family toxin [Deltaproteobacteria bacterium]|nr:BrnT family toxin [Deltaproteobacteria bacterium]
MEYNFEWDIERESENIRKHKCSFKTAIQVFADPNVIHLEDSKHSTEEDRYYAVGRVESGEILTVRYTVRADIIRIFGVAKWRKWSKFYEQNTRSK